MEWSCCNKCEREIVKEKQVDFCIDCWWENEVEKVEINFESIENFMERHLIFDFNFERGEYAEIEIQKKEKVDSYGWYYHTKARITKLGKIEWWEKSKNGSYSIFLEKLSRFAKEKEIERISAKYQLWTRDELRLEILKLDVQKRLNNKLEKEK